VRQRAGHRRLQTFFRGQSLEHGSSRLSTQCQQRELLGQHVVIHWLPSRLGTVTDELWHSVLDRHWRYAAADDWNVDYGATESDPLPCASGGNKFCYRFRSPLPSKAAPPPIPAATGMCSTSTPRARPAIAPIYELYNAQNPTGSSAWTASNGAIFHLGSNALRTDGWTSADAAGLPVLPGLVRYDEVMAGEIRHAIRFTVSRSQQGYIPRRHTRPATPAPLCRQWDCASA